jgi:hypothetical protein
MFLTVKRLYTVKRLSFSPPPAAMSLTKLSLVAGRE